MKRLKKLAIVNIIQIVLLISAIIAAIIIMPDIMLFRSKEPRLLTEVNGTEIDKYGGYADVTLYGAVPDDGKDDTSAFLNAVKTGAAVYVPIGTFEIRKTVNLESQGLKGAGTGLTVIIFTDAGTIINASGSVTLDDITLSFSEDSVTGSEAAGEQVAVYDSGMTAGSMLRAVKMTNVGTGFYSPANDISAATTLESVIIDKFSYRAIDIERAQAAVIRSSFIGGAKNDVEASVSLGGSFTVESLAFSGNKSRYPLELLNAESAVIKSLLFDNTESLSGSFIRCVSSLISMQTTTVKDSKGTSLIKIEDSSGGIVSSGSLISLYSDSGKLIIDEGNRIKCENNKS